MLRIRKNIYDAIVNHAQAALPLESCGFLAEKNGVIERLFPLTNIDVSHEHFSLDPKEQFAALRELRAAGMQLRCVYHSHPATPARPSLEDIKLAYDPNLSYVIVSLALEPVLKSFRIQHGNVEEESVTYVQNQENHNGNK